MQLRANRRKIRTSILSQSCKFSPHTPCRRTGRVVVWGVDIVHTETHVPVLLMDGSKRWRKKNIIYTRGGDKGESSLFNGDRAHKSSTVFEVLGTIDELSAFVGQAYVVSVLKNGLTTKLKHIMSCLLDLGSYVATPRDSASTTAEAKLKTMFEKESVNELEKWIDAYTNKLPNLTSFILADRWPRGIVVTYSPYCLSPHRDAFLRFRSRQR